MPTLSPIRDYGRRHRVALTVAGSLLTAAVLAFVLAGRRDDFVTALTEVAL